MISLLFMTESRQFRSFIIITMILIATHESATRWEEVLGAGWIAASDRKCVRNPERDRERKHDTGSRETVQ